MSAPPNRQDALSLQVERLMAETRYQLQDLRLLLELHAKVLDECRRLILAHHPEAARALAALNEEVAAHMEDGHPPLPDV